MSRLNPDAEKLVQAGRTALRPSDADRERVFRALVPKLGLGLAASTSTPSHAPTAAKAALLKSGAVLVGLGVVGAGLFFALRPEPMAVPKPPALAPASPAPAAPAPVGGDPRTPAPVSPEAPPVEKRAPAPSRSADNLAQEVAILSRAGAELHAGDPLTALSTLEEHRRKFPNGVLTQERTAARVQALCALGRTKEARAELARLARISPNSPHEARARKACGSALAEEK